MPSSKGLAGVLAVAGLVSLVLLVAPSGLAQDDAPALEVTEVTPLDEDAESEEIGSDSESVVVDAVIEDHTGGTAYEGSYTVHFNVTDAAGDATQIATVSFAGPQTDFVDGSTAVRSSETEDGAGNWTPVVGSFTFTVDVVAHGEGEVHRNTTDLELGPDLVVQGKTSVSPAEPLEGEDVTFEATVANNGTWDVPADDNVTVALNVAGSTFTGEIDPLKVDETATLELGPWTAEPGTHTFSATADADGNVTEITVDNNDVDLGDVDVEPTDPNLAVTNIVAEPPFPSGDGPVGIEVEVSNTGQADAGATTVRLDVDGEAVSEKDLDAIAAGGTGSATWEIEPDVGVHLLEATVDPADDVAESDEDDNAGSEELTVGPALSVEDLSVSPETPERGDNVSVSFTVVNEGAAVDAAFDVVFTVDGDTVDDATLDGIEAGAERNVELGPWTAEGGSHTLGVAVDPGGEVDEADDGGNSASVDVDVDLGGPELSVQEPGLPAAEVAPGDEVAFEATVANDGPVRAEDVTVTFALGGSTIGDPVTVDALEPGEAETVTSGNWTAERGQHTLTVTAEVDGGAGGEAQMAFAVGPNLVPTEVTVEPETPKLGETLTVTAPVENTGTQPTSSFDVALGVDGDQVHTTTVDNASARSTVQVELTWTVDRDPDQISVTVDTRSSVDEVDEDDNALTRALDVDTDVPDLVAGDVRLDPADPAPGDNVTFSVNVTNQGAVDAGAFEVVFRVDGTELGSAPVDGLAAGEATTATSDPWTATEGASNLTVEVDPTGQVAESDAENNKVTLSVTPEEGSGVPGPGALLALAAVGVAALARAAREA